MNAFILHIPDNWTDEKRKELYDRIDKWSFMLLHFDGNFHRSRYAFVTEEQFADLDSVREAFRIPDDVIVIDGSHHDLSGI